MTNGAEPVFQEPVMNDLKARESDWPEFPVHETHGIAQWPAHRLITDSRGLGWHDAYTSLATEAPWRTTLRAVPHYCLAYCHNRTAQVTRTIDGERGHESTLLRPRQLGVVPADVASSWTLSGRPDIQLVYLRREMIDRLADDMLGISTDGLALLPKLGFADGILEPLVLALLDTIRSDTITPADGIYADHLIRMMPCICFDITRVDRSGKLAAAQRCRQNARNSITCGT